MREVYRAWRRSASDSSGGLGSARTYLVRAFDDTKKQPNDISPMRICEEWRLFRRRHLQLVDTLVLATSPRKLEARVGFEPTNGGFADLSLGPLGYRAVPENSMTYSYYSIPYVRLAAKFAATFGPSLPRTRISEMPRHRVGLLPLCSP
jgi:hypothetical protein